MGSRDGGTKGTKGTLVVFITLGLYMYYTTTCTCTRMYMYMYYCTSVLGTVY